MTGKVQGDIRRQQTPQARCSITVIMRADQNPMTVERTESTYTYKGPDCGSVKPIGDCEPELSNPSQLRFFASWHTMSLTCA